jgi:hypothetical protein
LGVALAWVGCAEDAELRAGFDGGAAEGPDGRSPGQDASMSIDAGAGGGGASEPLPARLPSEPGGSPPPNLDYESSDDAVGRSPRVCSDNVDNDGQGGTDCDDPSCQRLRSCCVGHGDCCAPASEPIAIDFRDCGSDDAASCLAAAGVAATLFGDPLPRIVAGGLAPSGDARFDSGVALEAPVDLRTHRVSFRLRFAGATCASGECREATGVGLTARSGTFDDESHVRPLVSLVATGFDDSVRLVVGGETLQRWTRGGDDTEWTLTVRPNGRASVQRGSETLIDDALVGSEERARTVVYGRNASPDAPVRLLSLERRVALCDMPEAWSVREPLRFEGDGSASLRDPSVARDGSGLELVAFSEPRAAGSVIRLAEREDGTLRMRDASDAPALAPSQSYDAAGASSPELVYNPTTLEWILLYTASRRVGERTVRTIGRAVSTDGRAFVADPEPVLRPETFGVLDLSEPTVARRADGEWAVVARVRVAGDEPEATESASDRVQLWVFRGDDALAGQRLTRFSESDLDALTELGAAQVPGFVGDELREPSLIIHNGAWQLYYALRRGSRWTVRLLASDALQYWRHVNDAAPVLGPGTEGFDVLGARGPAAVSRPEAVELLYVGLDGVRGTPARALRAATDQGTF